MIVTVYKDIYTKNNGHYIDAVELLNYIKNGRWKEKIHLLRQCDDKSEKSRHKNNLPSICFSGKFKERSDKGIEEHSGLVILDFDHVENLKEFKNEISKDPYTFAAFISPSGDGLKVLIKIPNSIEEHESYYIALIDKYPTLDRTSRNISRVCFASFDPDLFLNENSLLFDTKGKIEKRVETKITYEAQQTDYKKLQIACDMIRNANDGEKHHALIKASRLVGGFIAGGLVEEYEAIRLLEIEINKKDIIDYKAAFNTIQDGIDFGKKEPIIENNYKERIQKIIKEDIIIENTPAKDVVYCVDVADKIRYTYEHGTARGDTTHFEILDNHFRFKRGEISVMHGMGNHGKSTMLYQLCLIKSVKTGIKWGVFSPENMPVEEFYKDLIHAYIGKSTEPYHGNQMSKEELENGIKFINDHFYLIYPEDEAPTPEYINFRFRELLIKHKIDGCIIDPYNQLDNDITKHGGREDQYLSIFLTSCKRFAVEFNLFYFIIAHPNGKRIKNKENNYECPDVYDLAGGAMWFHKCDNVLVTYRPLFSTNKDCTIVHFISQKIKKQKLNGIPGTVTLNYNRYTGRYYENDISPLDGTMPMKIKEELPINTEFDFIPVEKIPF